MSKERPLVGLGVIVENDEGKILVGKRIGSHAQKYSIPGGGLELGESFESGGVREIMEETGINIDPKNLRVIAVTNNLRTFRSEGFHSISVVLHAREYRGEPSIKEPHKCEEWLWVDPRELPQPHFDASELAVACWLSGEIYQGISD